MSVPAQTVSDPQGDALSTGRTEPNAQEQRADPTPPSGAETQEQSRRGPDYFRDAFSRMRGYTQNAAPAQPAPAEQQTGGAQAPQAPPASSAPVRETERPADLSAPPQPTRPATTLPERRREQEPSSSRIVFETQEEFDRRLQSEVDRRLAKQQQDEKVRADRAREVELRRTDPFEYARLMEEKEQQLQAAQQETRLLTSTLEQQLNHYDRNVLDILVSAVPEKERGRVISQSEGIQGRKETTQATLRELRKLWRAEGEASAKANLMKDQTFIKEMLARYGAASPEPEPVPVASASQYSPPGVDAGHAAVNSWIRSAGNQVRTGTGSG